jgi:hypothetical protein
MESDSSLIDRIDRGSENRQDILRKMKFNLQAVLQVELNFLRKIRNYLLSFFSKLNKPLLKFLRDFNNKLNIYTQLKREYQFQNIMEEKFIYMIGVDNGSYKSIVNILIFPEKNENQQNYFNC